MKNFFILILLCSLGLPAYALKVYTPTTSSTWAGGSSACQGATIAAISFKFNNCSSGSGAKTATPITVQWYQNTVNSTAGGTLVSTQSNTTGTGVTKTVTYVPSTAAAGVFYYYCVISWDGTGLCNTSGTLISSTTRVVTIKSAPAAITGSPTIVCVGSTITLADSTAGGTWSSSSAALATVGSTTGIVTGVAAGNVSIRYSTGCTPTATKTVTVVGTVAAITGTATVCAGATTTLSSTTKTGTWTSADPTIASIESTTGVVTGVSAGTTTISYGIWCGSPVTKVVTVNPIPGGITGNLIVCRSSTTSLSNSLSGGTWSSSTTSVATISSTTGVATGVATGTSTISYTKSSCRSTAVLTVNNAAATSITGVASVCIGQTNTLTADVSGGVWSSNNDMIATVSADGGVTGVAPGTTTISYNTGCGGYLTKVVTVSALTAPIVGSTRVCAGSTASLTSSTGTGEWYTSNPSVAAIDVATGVVTAISAGTATITYNEGVCSAYPVVTISAAPGSILGTASLCAGATTTLSNAILFGTWSSGNTGIATVHGTTGVVTGVGAGAANITYNTGCGAVVTRFVTVNVVPVISGPSALCSGSTSLLTNTAGGGTWSSSDTTVATVSPMGTIKGGVEGSVTITYTIGGCFDTTVISVSAGSDPGVVSGPINICENATTTFTSNGDTGGDWSSSDATVASVDGFGVVTGNGGGTAVITYSVADVCGVDYATKMLSVTPIPVVPQITGVMSVCIGATTTLLDSLSGGVWTSTAPGKATISSSGVVTGVASGTSNITYTVTNTCGSDFDDAQVTVNVNPAVIGGTATVCAGATTTLTEGTGGGTWSSGNTAVATVGSGGAVTGVSANTATISYVLPIGCYALKTVTVNTTPGAISGTLSICGSTTSTLSNSTAGGTWTSTMTSVATIGSATGIASGGAAGTSTINYTLSTGCRASAVITVNANPAAIGGTATVCAGATTTLTDGTTGGSWSVNNTSVATIDASTGILTGVAGGTATVTYTMPTGCIMTKVVTVNALPASINGSNTVCTGATTSLTDATTGGTWSSNATGIATVGSATGVVTGVASGSATITYRVTATGCVTTQDMTVNVTPSVASITGTATVCAGSNTTLSDATPGGTWSSTNPSVATVSGGVVTGVTAGNATISYTLTNGCGSATAIKAVTVNPLPSAGTITGTASVCAGSTTSLNDAVTGGTWSTSDATVATVSAGTVTGVAAGNATITYTVTNGCGTARATQAVTVNALPSAGTITGTASVCAGSTTNLNDAVTGGTWSTSDATVATVSAGTVTGVAAGNVTITYTVTNGCGTARATQAVTVNALPSAGTITGTASVCAGSTTNLNDAVTGGTWSTSDATVATVSAGTVTGVAAGNATITYTVTNGCGTARATQAVTVNALPFAGTITGAISLCVGSGTTLNNAATGGVWSSNTPGVATVTSAGVMSAVAAGTTIISYEVTAVCGISVATVTVTVNALASAGTITGTASVCAGSTTNLNDAVTGGTWSTSDATIATVSAGTVTGVAAGNATITYTVANGCGIATATKVVTVNALPSAGTVTGTATVCPGATTTFADAVNGGVWTSANAAIATVSASGVVTGVAAGNTTISYAVTTGCGAAVATRVITVSAAPNAGTISGTASVCPGATTTFTNTVTGGVWSSDNTSIATVTTGGVVTGVTTGTATISYTVSACGSSAATRVVTVNAGSATPITGTLAVCQGATTSLTNTATGGTWASGTTSVATVNSTTGVVTSVAAGNTTITYTQGGCKVTAVVTVNPLPGAITGTAKVCIGLTTALGNTTPDGTWATSNAAIATVDAYGAATGVSNGTAQITYTTPAGCAKTATFTVNPSPAPITGVTTVCVGSTTVLSCSSPGISWSSSDPSVASIGASTGVVTGVSAGLSGIAVTYTASTGCIQTTTVTVNALPASISGDNITCVGSSVALSSATPDGTWSSSNVARAAVDASTGIVTGVSNGTVTISYTLPTSCKTSYLMTVNPISAITGTLTICEGATTTLTNASTGGTWSSNNISIASVNGLTATTAVVNAVSAGVTTVTYTLPSGCIRVATVTVNAASGTISGARNVCVSSISTLSSGMTGGTWISSSATIASVGASTGIVVGSAAGTATITYNPGAGCIMTAMVTVNALPAVSTGTAAACIGATSTLSNTVPGGTWSSANTSLATVGSSDGIVSGLASGTVGISYTAPTGCARVTVFTVNALPTPINGNTTTCIGGTTALSNSTPGATSWISSNTAVATVGVSSGIVTGVGVGTSEITYTLNTGCKTTSVVTVTATASAGTISGLTAVCAGSTTILSSSVSGGTWGTSNMVVATVSATGVVTGKTSGSANITYTVTNGCGTVFALANVTVNPAPSSVAGAVSVCVGATTSLSATLSGGTWTISNPAVATIDAATGVVTGVTVGSAVVSYATTSGCTMTSALNSYPMPSAIGGPTVLCTSPVTLSDGTSGGTWSSSNSSVLAVSSGGVVTGVGTGTAVISYTTAGGCSATVVVSNPMAAVTGTSYTSANQAILLSDSTSGGTWSSGNATVATVDASGLVRGVSVGTAVISYFLPSGCGRTMTVTVYPPITGATVICVAQTSTLGETIAGGTWSAQGGSAVIQGPSGGVVTGLSMGTATVTYTIPTGEKILTTITVNPLPANIYGTPSVCPGLTTTVTNATPSGTWSLGDTTLASIDPVTGVATGKVAGNTTVAFTISGTGCARSRTFVVNSSPATMWGDSVVCVGSAVSLSDTASNPMGFTSGNASVATVGYSNGSVVGVTAGTTTITYTLGNGCYTTTQVTVNPLPEPIIGSLKVCPGGVSSLSSATSGGTWSSTTPATFSVSSDGAIAGLAAGYGTVSYTLASTGCARYSFVTVNASPTTISGDPRTCIGGTTTLHAGSGVWSSGNTSVATVVSSGGYVTGISGGTALISYITPGAGIGCQVTAVVTVNAAPDAGTISGIPTIVGTGSVNLGSTVYGGTWTSSNTTVATAGWGTGIVTGVNPGNATISYTVNNGCGPAIATYTVSVATSRQGDNTTAVTSDGVKVSIYPNPNNGTFTVKGSTGVAVDDAIVVEVMDMLGQSVYHGNVKAEQGAFEQQISITNQLANGMYFLNVRSGNKNSVFPIIVKQ